jgi:hypothetical protein
MSKWWMHFPKTGSRAIQDPTPRDYPQIKIGTVVRLRGKPNSQRRVIKTEWHRHRHKFVYIIETSAPKGFEPYWFYEQLTIEIQQYENKSFWFR